MYSIIEKFKKLARKNYPNGRAFVAAIDGDREKLHNALAKSQAKLHDDSVSTFDAAIADNENFTVADAEAWERRLGLITNNALSLPQRMTNINLKLNYPGTDAPRQHWTYIQEMLQAAGFDVYVYENNFGGNTMTPQEILSPGAPAGAVHSPGTYHGSTTRHGSAAFYTNKIANYLEEEKDASHIIGANYRSTFFVAGPTITTFADVDLSRKIEFRQLLLRLKPQQTVGFLFVNYV